MILRRRWKSEGLGFEDEKDSEKIKVPRILLLGPPGAGKTTLALALAAEYGSVLVSVEIEARGAAEAGSEQGRT